MNFRDTSDSYNGKMLKAVVKLDDNHDAMITLYYSPEHKRVTNSFGVSYNEQTGFHTARLNVNKMRNEGNFHVGGIGQTTVVGEPVKRQTIKGLWDIANKLDESTINTMTTTELKQLILAKSFGGIMYDVTEGSAITRLVLDNDEIANVLVDQITSNQASNGIDKGVANFITEVIAKNMVQA